MKHREEIDGVIDDIVKQKTTQEWLEIFEGSGMPYSAINDIQGTLNHSHGMYLVALVYIEYGTLTISNSLSSWYGARGRAPRLWNYQACQYASQILPCDSWHPNSTSDSGATHERGPAEHRFGRQKYRRIATKRNCFLRYQWVARFCDARYAF